MTIKRELAIALALGAFASTSLRAGETSYTDLEQRLSQVEQQLNSRQWDSGGCASCGSPGCADPCQSCGGGCQSCCGGGGGAGGGGAGGGGGYFFFGAEAVFARPYFDNNGAFTVLDLPGQTEQVVAFNFDFAASPRMWLGYMAEDGTGVRARYWNYQDNFQARRTLTGTQEAHAAPFMTVNAAGNNSTERLTVAGAGEISALGSLAVDTLDLEAFSRMQLRNTELVSSVGLRYIHKRTDYLALDVGDPTDNVRLTTNSDGIGPTFSTQVRRDLGYDLTFFAGPRVSFLYASESGRLRENSGNVVTRNSSELMSVLEANIGVEYTMEMAGGSQFFTRSSLESQYWTNAGNIISDVNSMGFLGLAVSAGVNY